MPRHVGARSRVGAKRLPRRRGPLPLRVARPLVDPRSAVAVSRWWRRPRAAPRARSSSRSAPDCKGPSGLAGDGLRDRPRERVGVRTRREGEAVGHHLGGLRSRAPTACTSSAQPGATPVKVISGLKGPLGLVWRDEHAVRGLDRPRRGVRRSARHPLRYAQDDPARSPPATAGTRTSSLAPDGRLIMSIASACDHCTTTSRWSASIVSFDLDGIARAARYASRVRAAFGLAYYPGTSTLLASMNQRDDLGAQHAGRRAGGRARGRRLEVPRVLRPGRQRMQRGCRRCSRRSTSTPQPAASRS